MHFAWPPQSSGGPGWHDDPFAFLAALLTDEIAVVSNWIGNEIGGGSAVARDEIQSELERSFPENARVRIRPWLATLNRDVRF